MSFLNFKIPVESLDHVLAQLLGQVKAGRLEASSPTWVEAIEHPSIEIKRLKEIVQREFKINKNAELVPALVEVDHTETFWVCELIARGGSCFIFCLEEYKEGAAIWTDQTRECTLDRNTILKCEEGCIEATTKGCGGVFLLLINKPSEELM